MTDADYNHMKAAGEAELIELRKYYAGLKG